MAGLDADTSSYNQPLPVSPLDVAGKIGGLQQQGINIDKSKLDLMTQQFGVMNQELSTMIDDPNITKPQAAERLVRISKTLNLPPIATNHMMEELNAAPDVKSFSMNALRRGMETMQKYGVQVGANASEEDSANKYQGVRLPPDKGGGFIPATRMPVQPPPTQPNLDPNATLPNGQPNPGYLQPGIVGAAEPSGVVPVPQARPNSLPVERLSAPVSGPSGPTVQTGFDFKQRFAGEPNRIVTGPPPLFEEGKRALTDDQALAAGKMQAVKPAIQALKLMPGLRTGPGTGQFNDLVAAAKAWGIVDTAAENDPTVLRQQLSKKLAQYVGSNPVGQRSDAAQTLAEAGSPDPKKQLSPALINLTRDAITLDRVQAARALSFKNQDLSKYGEHRAKFPQSIDERAFGLDLMPDADSKKLVDKMHIQYKNGGTKEKNEAVKFFKSLDMAKSQGFFDQGE